MTEKPPTNPGFHQKPHRRITVQINVSGDTWLDAARLLVDVLEHVETHGQACDLVHGGPDAGAYVKVTEDPEMTHERYHEALSKYLDKHQAVPTPTHDGDKHELG